MRSATAGTILVLLLPLVVRGQEAASPQTDPPHTDIRGEMMSEYKFTPPGAKPAVIPTSLQSDAPPLPAPTASSADVVKMEPFVVRESAPPLAALLPLEHQSPDKPPATVASKLGIGEHDFMVGKLHAFVVTIFYVPLVAGFSW
jgi:hypothetical protein